MVVKATFILTNIKRIPSHVRLKIHGTEKKRLASCMAIIIVIYYPTDALTLTRSYLTLSHNGILTDYSGKNHILIL